MSVNNQRLLEGTVVESKDAQEVTRLRELTRHLTEQVNEVMAENLELKNRLSVAGAPIERLRQNLSPLYKALQAVFGDIDAIGPEASTPESPSGPVNARAAAAWDEWKARLPGAPAKIIDALHKHGNADTTQLCILIGTTRRQTVHDAIHKLNKSGLIDKNGDRFSLKQL